MSAEREFRIKITTQADPSGAQQTVKGLEDATEATKKGGEAAEKATKEVHRHAEGHRELHRAMHAVTEESPVLGLALRAALSPMGALLTGVILVFRQFKEQIDELNKHLDELGAVAAGSIGKMRESAREAGEEIAKSRRAYDDWIQSISAGSNQISADLDADIEKLNEQTTATRELMAAQKDLALEKVRQGVASGAISKEEGAAREGEIEAAAEAALNRLLGGSAQQQSALLGSALMGTSGAMKELAPQLEAAQAAKDDPNRARLIKDLPKQIADGEKNLEKYTEEASKAQEKLDQAHAAESKFVPRALTASGQQREREAYHENYVAPIEAEAAGAIGLRDKSKRAVEESRSKLAELTAEQDKATKAADRLRTEFEKLKVQFDALSRRLESARSREEIAGPTRDQVAGLHAAAIASRTGAQIVNTPQMSALGQAYHTSQALAAHQEVTDADRQQMQAIASLVAGHNLNVQQSIALLTQIVNSQETLNAAFRALEQRVNDIANWHKTSRAQ